MHGEMYANAAAAPYSGPPPVTFIRLVRFRNIAGIADENRALGIHGLLKENPNKVGLSCMALAKCLTNRPWFRAF